MKFDAFYFGCWDNRAGHFLYRAGGRSVHERSDEFPPDFPVKVYVLDGGLLGYVRDEVQGEAVLTHTGGWTILSFWDRSGDSRGASNSNFVLRGHHDLNSACDLARENFPSVWSRFNFRIVLRLVPPAPHVNAKESENEK